MVMTTRNPAWNTMWGVAATIDPDWDDDPFDCVILNSIACGSTVELHPDAISRKADQTILFCGRHEGQPYTPLTWEHKTPQELNWVTKRVVNNVNSEYWYAPRVTELDPRSGEPKKSMYFIYDPYADM